MTGKMLRYYDHPFEAAGGVVVGDNDEPPCRHCGTFKAYHEQDAIIAAVGAEAFPEHTPGPWSLDWDYCRKNGKSVRYRAILGGDGNYVVTRIHSGPGGNATEANARLIAAAPELLAALQQIMGCCGENLTLDCEKVANDAIAKALC